MAQKHSLLKSHAVQYMIQGSANINQRSMDGGRDTELAIGAYQPHYLAHNSDQHTARGQVCQMRINLFKQYSSFSSQAPASAALLATGKG